MRTPASTYRLQITPEFTFDQAADQIDYVRDLGADWLYLSPVLQATEGSAHGYDVVDPTTIDQARGGREGFDRLCRQAHEAGLGVLVDIVPNHQGVAAADQNPWWWSVLREGRESSYADAFDIDWAACEGTVMIPVLGDDTAADGTPVPGCSEQALGQLTVTFKGHEPVLKYWENVYPVAEGTYTVGTDGTIVDDPADVHQRQHYRLVNWRLGDRALNYRRFFTVTTLAGVRVEDPHVFTQSHQEIKRWFDQGLVDGLRVDHPDGLREPGGYLGQLHRLTDGAYVVIEKILEPGEHLPPQWITDGLTTGTTGYDALGVIDRLFVDPHGAYPLTTLDASLRQLSTAPGTSQGRWGQMIYETKRAVVDGALHAEVQRLAREAATDTRLGAYTHEQIVQALSELLCHYEVYRTYLPFGGQHLEGAVLRACAARPQLGEILTQVGAVLGTQPDGTLTPVAQRFQQTSGMVMAKGVEDSAFYRYSRLTSLTEVGGDPSVFSLDPQRVHEIFAWHHKNQPLSMTTVSTHDTKRSESVRARISVIAEVAQDWVATVTYINRQVAALGLEPLSDRTLTNLVLQALAGAWPVERQRAVDYALKAAREAQTATAWVDGCERSEQQLVEFVDAVLNEPSVRGAFEAIVRKIQVPGYSNALGQKLVQLTMPGVPDVYQGSELWAPALVDPDNRRPVDYQDLACRLAALDAKRDDPGIARIHSVPAVDGSGEAKMLVTSRALRLRRDRPELFTGYTPLIAQGPAAEHLFGFDRGGAITLVTRLPMGLAQAGGWRKTTVDLPHGVWVDELTGSRCEGSVLVAEVLDLLPVALLRRA